MNDRFIARQPIFDRRLRIFGYELLFRAGPENRFRPGQSVADDVIVNSTMLFDTGAAMPCGEPMLFGAAMPCGEPMRSGAPTSLQANNKSSAGSPP